MKRFPSVILLSTLLTVLPLASQAAMFRVAKDDNELFSINIPVQDDLYIAGGVIQIKERIAGDLVAAGGDLTISDEIEQDLIVAGGTVIVEGNIGDDARIAGGEVSIRGRIEGDLIVFGGTVRLAPTAQVMGDAIVYGGLLVVDGAVETLRSAGGSIILSGLVRQNADVRGDSLQLSGTIKGDAVIVCKEANVLEGASIEGNLQYWLSDQTNPFEGIVGGESVFNADLAGGPKGEVIEATVFGALTLAAIAFFGYSLLSAALVILILVLSTKTFFPTAVKKLTRSPWGCMLTGLLYFVVVPAVGLLFLISIIGIPIAMALFFAFGLSLFFAKPIAAIVLAQWLLLHWKKPWGKIGLFFVALAVYVVLKLFCFVPVIGWIAIALAIFLTFGALLRTKAQLWKKFA
ncbi:hypothetical protein COU80_05515 [Candidatus Peregrinibacteria bacterium CG10_big_fil_rev_8_21_14_0_10_55_24]|nr:MAG: hypothetical protein COU80_05515 [Candidatus Peregrinibacteria bacterium CG10_big_fil_rev_8_21_14_0_10_55_24]